MLQIKCIGSLNPWVHTELFIMFASESDAAVDDDLATLANRFITNLLCYRILYMSVVQFGWPWAAARLLFTGDELQSHLDELREWWRFYQKLEHEALVNRDAEKFRMKLVWPLWRWVHQIFVVLAEYGFEMVLSTEIPILQS